MPKSYVEAFMSDVARMGKERKQLAATLKKTPNDAKAKKRIEEIDKAFNLANAERLYDKAAIQDKNTMKAMIKNDFGF